MIKKLFGKFLKLPFLLLIVPLTGVMVWEATNLANKYANAEKLKQNMAMFNSYVCGGFEYLQEKFGSLDKTEDVVDAVYELVHEFAVDMELLDDGELPDFDPKFD